MKESTDNGATFGAEQAIVTAAAAVVDLAVAYKTSAGDLAIAWVTATGVGIIKRTSAVFGAAATTSPGVSSFSGIAMAYGFDWDMAVTGVEVTTLKPSLWTLVYGDGNDAALNTWGTLTPQQQAESDASVTYKAPSIAYADTYRINVVEADAFTGGATRVYRTSIHPTMTFVAGPLTLRSFIPVNYGGAEGLALAADGGGAGYVYESAPDAIYRAPRSQSLATLTADVVAAAIDERGDATSGYIDVDNSSGAYAGPPSSLAIGNLVALSWGYRTATGAPTSRMADLWIAAFEHRRDGGVSTLRLYVEGGWELLRRSRQRTQVVHTADTYLAIVLRVFSRAGLQLTTGGSLTRAQTLAPKFTVHPQTSAFEAVRQALTMLADRVRMRPLATAAITEPLASAAVDYSFGAAAAPHPLRAVRARGEAAPVSEAQAFGAGAFGEAIDFAAAAQGVGTREQQRDITSTSGASAAATATAYLRQRALDADGGAIIVPPNCGQEILDVIDFSDALIASSAVKRRVTAIRWRFDRRRGVYEQELRLGPV